MKLYLSVIVGGSLLVRGVALAEQYCSCKITDIFPANETVSSSTVTATPIIYSKCDVTPVVTSSAFIRTGTSVEGRPNVSQCKSLAINQLPSNAPGQSTLPSGEPFSEYAVSLSTSVWVPIRSLS